MTTTTPTPARGHRVVLHVVDTSDSGVRAAAVRWAIATPDVEHHLLHGMRAATPAAGPRDSDAEDLSAFATVRTLPPGRRSARRSVRRAVRDIRPDVVHAHAASAGAVVRSAIRSTPACRIAYSPHGFAFERLDLSPAHRRLARAAERLRAGNTDSVIARSPIEARAAAELGVRRVVEAPHVPRVPALAHFEHRRSAHIVGSGRIGAQADSEFFRATVALLGVACPDLSAVWIGDGGDHTARRRLEGDGVHVTGWLPGFDASRALGSGGVYLHTARWQGVTPAILEAIELGVPVVARDVEAIRGQTATPGLTTPMTMAAAAADIIAGGDDARQANIDRWRSMLARHTPEQVTHALTSVYGSGSARPLLVNGGWLTDSTSDEATRYASAVTRRLLAGDPSLRVVVPRGAVLPDWLPAARVLRSRLRGAGFVQLALPRRARGSMLVTLGASAPLLAREQLVVMHDHSDLRLRRRLLARRVRHLVALSRADRTGFANAFGVEPSRFAVAPDGGEHSSQDPAAGTILRLATDAPVPVAPLVRPTAAVSLDWPPPTGHEPSVGRLP